MKRATAIAALASATALGAFGMASTTPNDAAHLVADQVAAALALDDVWVDAERSFRKIDVDRDGEIDIDEYAAQAVVYAGLIRFNGVVAIDGREPIQVGLPRRAVAAIGPEERSAIDAVARADYYEIAGSGPITSRRWVALRMASFERADRNGDSQLTGRELDGFAMERARYDAARDRWI